MHEKQEVIKHSAAIHIQNNITLLQRRAWNILLANAYDELPNEKIKRHRIREKALAEALEFDSKKRPVPEKKRWTRSSAVKCAGMSWKRTKKSSGAARPSLPASASGVASASMPTARFCETNCTTRACMPA